MGAVPISTTVLSILGIWLSYQISIRVWSIYFSTLSKVPGPTLAAATRSVLSWHKIRGDAENWKRDLHLRYGLVVRVAPDEVSIADGAAWREIYAAPPGQRFARFPKDPMMYNNTSMDDEPANLVTANDADHARHRKIFAHAFSEKAVREQEPLILQYTSQMMLNVKRLGSQKFDLVKQLNFTTFDIMADLAFGEPLGCLSNSEYIPWITMILDNLRIGTLISELKHLPTLKWLLFAMLPASMKEGKKRHEDFTAERVNKRLSQQTSKPDIWRFVLAAQDKGNELSPGEMHHNAGLFMIAGTETTATTLSGLSFYLLKNPETMRTLVKEIRDKFASPEEIHAQGVLELKYLNACIQEAMRVYPPVPIGINRVIPRGGSEICGYQMPEGTIVYVHQLSAYHHPDNFVRPKEFLPQRWLTSNVKSGDDSPDEFANDDKSCVQPFSLGPRACIGISLAWLEMRLIFVNLLWQFDLELCEESQDWEQQKVFFLWQKNPLMIVAKPVVR